MTNLSPAAQSVLDAFTEDNSLHDWKHNHYNTNALAAALRAAADQVLPLTPKPNDTFCCPPVATILWKRVTDIRSQLLAIAAELEGAQ
jgi:hypothetical protein